MRRLLFPCALLVSAAAVAQVGISDEVLSDPLKPRLAAPFAAPAVAVAKDRTGPAIAWTMGAKIYVARLDAAGHATGAVRELPLATQSAIDAMAPSMAASPDGNGFVLGWLELDQFLPTRMYPIVRRLDAALVPSEPASLNPSGTIVASPILVRTKGDTAWIAHGSFLWALGQDGTMRGPLAGMIASDMTIAANAPQLIGSHPETGTAYTCSCEVTGFTRPYCPGRCQVPTVIAFALDFTTLGATAATTSLPFVSSAQPAIAGTDGQLLFAWFRGTQGSGGAVVLSRMTAGDVHDFGAAVVNATVLADFPADAGQTRPDIAIDGARAIVVWRRQVKPASHDVVGVAIDENGKQTPLSIATSPADERDPSILALGGGTFLVVYEKVANGEHRIATRVVSFGGTRHRATR